MKVNGVCSAQDRCRYNFRPTDESILAESRIEISPKRQQQFAAKVLKLGQTKSETDGGKYNCEIRCIYGLLIFSIPHEAKA